MDRLALPRRRRRLTLLTALAAAHPVTIVVGNRAHGPAHAFVAIGVGTQQAAPSGGRVALATRLTGHGSGSATVTLLGTRACWTIRNLHGVGHARAATIRRGGA